MKNIFTLFLFIAGSMFIGTSLSAQCPTIASMDNIVLYVDDNSCSATLNYENPEVIDFCHSSTAFYFTGHEEIWVVPAGVTEVMINAYGAQGGHGSGPTYDDNKGGLGGFATGKLAVSPGDTLRIRVGGSGQNAQIAATAQGGWNGGGTGGLDAEYTNNGAAGGGGATDVRFGGNGLENRVLVAAGGGGASKNAPGGAGGAENGLNGSLFGTGQPGIGGSAIAGGMVFATDRGATPGALGVGGNGSTNHPSWGGGGGGAGYYGGSGGTATADHNYGHAGGGGGGSSFVGDLKDAEMRENEKSGNGILSIHYSDPLGATAIKVAGPETGSVLSPGLDTLTFATYTDFDTIYSTVPVSILDTISPQVIAQPVSVELNEFGEANVDPASVDNGSTDNCSIVSYTLSQELFTEADLGDNVVTFTVSDASGNVSSAEVIVTIEERAPEALVMERSPDDDNNGSGAPGTLKSFKEVKDEHYNAAVKLYPNPATDNVQLAVELPEIWETASIIITGVSGRRVLEHSITRLQSGDRIGISVQDWAPGLYVIQLIGENHSITERLVVR